MRTVEADACQLLGGGMQEFRLSKQGNGVEDLLDRELAVFHVDALMSAEDLESLEETLDVLNDEPLMADICEALAERTSNPRVLLTKNEALQLLYERWTRRIPDRPRPAAGTTDLPTELVRLIAADPPIAYREDGRGGDGGSGGGP